MSDFEERARRAAEALRQEGARVSDTDAALADVLAGRSTLELVEHDGWSRRRTYAVAALTLGTAASLIGLAVVTLGDDEGTVGDGAVPPDGPVALPSEPSTITVAAPATATGPPTSTEPSGISVEDSAPDIVPQPDPTLVPASSSQPSAKTLPPIPTTTARPPSTPLTDPTAPTTSSTEPSISTEPTAAWTPTQPPAPNPPAENALPYLEIGWVGGDYYQANYRIEPAWSPSSEGTYVQAFSNADGSQSLYVRTMSPRPELIVEPIQGKIGPWDLFDGFGEHNALTLATDDVAVTIGSNWLDFAQLRALAEQIGPRPDGGAGWDVGALPGDVELVGEGYSWVGDERSFVVVNSNDQQPPLAQIDVTLGVEGYGTFPLAPFELAPGARIIDFDRRRALYEPGDDFAALTWEYAPGVYVTFRRSPLPTSSEVSADEIREIARRIEETTQAKWQQTPVLPQDERCHTFDC